MDSFGIGIYMRDVDILRRVTTSDRLKSEAQSILLQVGKDNWKSTSNDVEIKSGDHFLID